MIEKETFLAIATESWDSLWRSTQQYLSRLALRNQVIYLEPARRPDHSGRREFFSHLKFYFTKPEVMQQGNLIRVSSPTLIPFFRQNLPSGVLAVTVPITNRINTWIRLRHIRRVEQTLKVKNPILFLLSPDQKDLVGSLAEKGSIYFNYDEFSIFTENQRIKSVVEAFDDELTRKVDVVFATSRLQWQKRKGINPNTWFLPNGVDFELFHRALSPELTLPPEIKGLPKPIIGYAGMLGPQIDLELIDVLTESYAAYSFVFVGPDQIGGSPLKQKILAKPNVHFLGFRERVQLAGYLKTFDVALIPYALRGFVLTAHPLKLQEYLAAGRSVVATAMPELQDYRTIIRIGHTTDEFVQLINEAITDYSPEAIEKRVACARQNTWDQRFTEMDQRIEASILNKKAGIHGQ